MSGIQKAIDAAGGRKGLAEILGVSTSFVHQLVSGKRVIPFERCPEIERKTGVPRWELRPDAWWVVWPELVDHVDAPPVPTEKEVA